MNLTYKAVLKLACSNFVLLFLENSGLPVEHRQRVFDNGTLMISKVSRKDAGTYACTATDRQGTSSTQSGTIKVIGKNKAFSKL